MIESLKYANKEYYENYCKEYAKFLNAQVVYVPRIRTIKEQFIVVSTYLHPKKGWMAAGFFPKKKMREVQVSWLYKLRDYDTVYDHPADVLPYEGVVAIEQFY